MVNVDVSLPDDPTLQEVLLAENQKLREEISALKIRLGQIAVDLMRKSAEASEAQETLKRWRPELKMVALTIKAILDR